MVRVLTIGRYPIVCVLILCMVFIPGFTKFPRGGMTARQFESIEGILEVECDAQKLDFGADLLTMKLFANTLPRSSSSSSFADNGPLAFVRPKTNECMTRQEFSSCVIDSGSARNTKLKMLVLDLRMGESRLFGCNLTSLDQLKNVLTTSWSLLVTRNRTTTTVAPTTTTSTTTTIRPQQFQLPISVVIIGLVLLIFFAILCAILVILQCRGKRRRRSRAANRESLLSAKNEPMGEGGYRTPRNIPSYPPGHMPPETPGGNFAMRYQKSIPDTGYVSGSSVYYSEPYGTLDEEMKERLRPNPRMCHIPYDIKGGPLDTTHPQEHSA